MDVINFQETWITDKTYFADFNISGYTVYVQPATCSTHSGLITYIKTSLQSTKLIDFTHQNSQTWEGMFIEIENLNKTVIIGNIYRPPRESNHEISQFIDELNITIQNRKLRNKKIILSGDFNINLLKLNEKQVYANYFDMLTTNSLLPNITHPTRIRRTSATLIDNIFSNTLGDNVKSGIITNRLISDHQIIFSCFENIINFHKPTVTKKIIKLINYIDLKKDVNQLIQAILDSNSTSDPNVNYNLLEYELTNVINTNTTTKLVKYNKFKHKNNPWITASLIKSIKFRDKLHLKSKNPHITREEHTNIKTFNTIIKKNIRNLKKIFISRKFDLYKNDLKQTWCMINNVLCRSKSDSISNSFIINGEEINNPQIIADNFNDFFINVGGPQFKKTQIVSIRNT